MTNVDDKKLGRLPQFDERSREFAIRTLLPAEKLRSYTWHCPVVIDQDNEGTCVGHAWAHEMAAKPLTWQSSSYLARLIYREACIIDPWSGNDQPIINYNYGTSVIAGAKIATQLGHYTEYRWAFGINDLLLAIGYKGPAVLGINWYADMFDPDPDGLLHVSGATSGGHAILANGVNVKKKLVRLHNSWGTDWGVNGEAFISFDDLERLLNEQGEACIPITRINK